MRIGLFVFACLFGSLAFAQIETVSETVLWFQHGGKIKLSEKASISTMLQYRSFQDREEGYHILLAASVNQSLGNGFYVGAGFANLNINRPADDEIVLVPELRPFQQIGWKQPIGKLTFDWRTMVEERYFRNASNGELVDGYTFMWRFRNLVKFGFPLSDNLGLNLSSEIFLHAGKNSPNILDQHRTMVMFNRKFDKISLSMGYMHWFFQNPGDVYENRHTWVFGVSQTF